MANSEGTVIVRRASKPIEVRAVFLEVEWPIFGDLLDDPSTNDRPVRRVPIAR